MTAPSSGARRPFDFGGSGSRRGRPVQARRTRNTDLGHGPTTRHLRVPAGGQGGFRCVRARTSLPLCYGPVVMAAPSTPARSQRRYEFLDRLGIEPTISSRVRRRLEDAIADAERRWPSSVAVLDAGCGRKSPLIRFRDRIDRFVGVDQHAADTAAGATSTNSRRSTFANTTRRCPPTRSRSSCRTLRSSTSSIHRSPSANLYRSLRAGWDARGDDCQSTTPVRGRIPRVARPATPPPSAVPEGECGGRPSIGRHLQRPGDPAGSACHGWLRPHRA